MKSRLLRSPVAWITLTLLAISTLLGIVLQPYVARGITPDPVTAAWNAVRAAGSYRFTSDVTQVTMPLATLTNVGRASRTEQLYLEGQNDLNAQTMEFTLWSQGGSALNADSGLSIRSEGGKTFTRHAGGEWQETDDFTGSLAPQGDFLSYLAAIKAVQAQPGERRGGIDFTRYTFTIDSPRFATYMHTQMEAALRAKGELPPGMQLDVPAYFRDMVGTGELWVGNDGLPLRQILTLQFPAQDDEQVQSQIVVNFSQFGVAQSLTSAQGAGSSQWVSAAALLALTANALPYALILALFACAILLIYFRRAHRLQMAVVILVIFAQVVGPLLSTYTNVKFFDTQTAKAAAAKERQAEAKSDQQIREALGNVEFNPHLSPLEKAAQEGMAMAGEGEVEMAASAANTMVETTALAATPLPSGATNWWKAEGNATDSLGGKGGTLNGSATFATGMVGQAFSFNGANGYVALPSNAFPFPSTGTSTAPFTLELWFKTASAGVILGQQGQAPYAALTNNYVPAIYIGSDGKLRVEMFWNGVLNPITSAAAVNNNTFQHLAVVYGNSTQSVYLNGTLVGSQAHTQTAFTTTYQYQWGTGFTTNWPAGSNGWSNFNGLIDEPTFYNRTLVQSEVQAIYNAGSSGKSQSQDSGLDTDGDTLTDFAEERIGTSTVISDTDSDGLNDNVEVNGFTFNEQRWYSDPTLMDSNGDSQGDSLEWGLTNSGFRPVPQDLDSDGFPDLFDNDNDGDGVPDNKDLAPYTKGAAAYNESTPLQLTIKNLVANKPTFVEFQLRPTDEKQLWFAYNVLDWPQDSQGQIKDIDGATYATGATASGRTPAANESNGDMRVVPMLEIRMPITSANLPPQSALTPFGISVNNLTADGQSKVAYVPLSLVTDEKTGQRVAFSGQMRYLPTGSWPSPHQARLVWVVQALVDLPCDPGDSSADCQTDGYRNNVPQVLQSYYSDWRLTGLNVREENGTDTAIFYEDPTVDSDLKDDAPIWGLAYALDGHFTASKDLDNNGRRDLTIADFPARFDRDNNPSEAQRFGIPNTLQVVTSAFTTIDQALASLTMTDTTKILSDVFKASVEGDRAIKPLLFFAQEYRTRQLNLDMLAVDGKFVTQSSADLTVDMAPSGQTAQPIDVMANLKWVGYCASQSNPITFAPCEDDVYWNELEARYGALPALAEDDDPEWMGARLQLAELYYTSLRVGYSRNVQTGLNISTLFIGGENENQTTTMVRNLLRLTASLPLLAAQSFDRILIGTRGDSPTQILALGKSIRHGIQEYQKTISTSQYPKQVRSARAALNLKMAALSRWRGILLRSGVAFAGVAAAILMATFQIISIIPSLPASVRSGFGWAALALNLALNIVAPILLYVPAVIRVAQVGLPALVTAFKGITVSSIVAKVLGAVGLVFSVVATWAFLIYSAVTSGQTVGSPALNRAAAGAIAATVITVLLFVLSFNPVGLIIGIILGVIDGLLTLLCQVGVSELRNVPGLGGACFTLTGALISAITPLIYSYDLMVNLSRNDLMLTGIPDVTLTNPTKGYVAGNSVGITLPVTTTIMHKDPDPNNGLIIYSYMYLFSQENLKRSTFKYSLTHTGSATPPVALDQMKGAWQNVRERNAAEGGKYLLSPMYRADVSSIPTPIRDLPLPVGINATIPFTLNMGFAIPAYECWTVLVVPVCYEREFKGDNHMPINALVYDVLPATLNEFMTLGAKADGGFRLAWDAKFPALRDADGDGLRSFVYKGLDPNDNSADSDNDGLTDAFELERQGAGEGSSPIQRDTDSDGLTDLQEIRLGSDPAVADSDNDGLKDGEEVYHLRYDPNTGLPTTVWEGGWNVTINAKTPFVVRVSSDPLIADGDRDGVNDLAERQLAQSASPADHLDKQNRPYHPGVPNTPPLALLVETNDLDGYLAPGQSFRYTSTVIANTAVEPGILTVNAPGVLGGSPNPLDLRFNPLTFSTAQTITKAINQVVSAGVSTQVARISSTANTRLPNTGAGGWRFAPITAEAPLPGVSFLSAATASRPDRQDSYWLANLATPLSINNTEAGDLLAYSIPGGSVRAIENDSSNTTARLQPAKPSLIANANGDTLAVMGQERLCNTVTLNSLKVVTPARYTFLTLQSGSGSEESVWGLGGRPYAQPGTQYGPNAEGFPLTLTYCGTSTFRLYEFNDPPVTPSTLIAAQTIDPYTPPTGDLLTFEGGGAKVELNVTVPLLDAQLITGALLGADGQIKRSITFPRSPIPSLLLTQNRYPVVASDGSGFLVAYESFSAPFSAATWGMPHVVLQAFGQDGTAIDQGWLDAGSLQTARFSPNGLALAAAWTGSSYRIIWQNRHEANLWQVFVNANGRLLTAKERIATDAQILTSDGLTLAGKTYAPGIAYDPVSGRTLITYLTGNHQLKALVYVGNSLVNTQLLNSDVMSPQVAWHPGYQGWLLSYQDRAARANHFFVPLDSNGAPAFPSTSGLSVATTDNTLACPAPQSAPVVDLRFEGPPDDEALPDGLLYVFGDASGYKNYARCSLPGCPAAGVSGAPNAPLSDYALQFDGVDDGLTMLNRPVQDNFTIAFWLKAPTGSGAQMLVDGGSAAANGFQIFLNNGSLAVNVPGFNSQQAGRIDDGQWHFVAVNRNKTTGRVEAYVDGNGVIGVEGAAGVTLNGASDLRIGKNRNNGQPLRATLDHLQIWGATLKQDTVQALYNRTNQSYCLAAGTTSNNLYWAKVQASQPDVRGGRLSASNGLTLTIDSNLPTASFIGLQNNEAVGLGQIIGGSASDATSGVGLVEVSVNNGAWTAAEGANSWAFSLAGYSGAISLRVRATDNVGNVGNPSAAINLTIDGTAPTLTVNPPATTIKPSQNANGRWQVNLNGTANDPAGIDAASLLVTLEQQSGVGVAQTAQPASLSGSNWSSNYLLNEGLYDPTGVYSVTVQATDTVGNRATPVKTVVRLDARGPEAALSSTDLARTVISQTITIGGVVSDTNSIVGIDKVEIAFTPIEQIAALPAGLTSEQAEPLLNRTWTPVTLAQRGAGVATTTWRFPVPTGLENSYQIDLRGYDLLGNRAISSNLWRGTIDTRDPRVVMRATATGATYTDTADDTLRHAVQFVCAVQDRNLDESSFVCPGQGLAEPVRSFENNAALQALFPDLTLRTGLAISYTLWTTTPNPAASASACDSFGRCAQASTGSATALASASSAAATSATSAAAPGAPVAVIVNPTAGSFVAANNAVGVTVAAEAGALLKEVVIKLDNATVQTLSFTQAEAVTRIVRTLNLPIANEGQHTLVAQATAWDNSTQTALFPVTFTLDENDPTVTLDPSALTIADTWVAQSGVLRFNGNASDSVGLAAVQIKEGDGDFTDVTFGSGTWRVALPLTDPEGRTLNITVRAIDRAGRVSNATQNISANLSAADAPNTMIDSQPANPSNTNTAQFTFSGTPSAVAFDCQLDEGPYEPCASPFTYSDLSKGSHTFQVRAIDDRGYPDLSPAAYSWTINASALDANITGKPVDPTDSRTATFTFTGTGSSLECSLDDAAFAACTSPRSYNDLSNGAHTFLVRARSGDNVGAAARHVWTVANVAPVAAGQTVNTTADNAVAITLVATDEDTLTYDLVPPANGLLLGIPPALTYTPNTGFVGTDSFTFVANDGEVDSNVAVVTVNVAGVEPPPTPTPTVTATPTATLVEPTVTATETPIAPTETPTETPVAPTATATETPVAPTATATATATETPVVPTETPTETPVAPTATATNTPVAPTATPVAPAAIYLSSATNGTLNGVAYQDEDILRYTQSGGWTLFFDGSDVGVGNSDLDAFHRLADGTILMSFERTMVFPGLGPVTDADIVRFTPTTLGNNTSGRFSLYFDGSDVGLTTPNEDIDAIALDPSGNLVISTFGTADVPGLRAQDEDLLGFVATSLGDNTSGTWTLLLDGSTVGLTAGSEDLDGLWLDPTQGNRYLSTKGNFTASGSSNTIGGDSDDIFGCAPTGTPPSGSCFFFAFFDGDLVGLRKAIDGISLELGSNSFSLDALFAADADQGTTMPPFELLPDAPADPDPEFDAFDLPREEESEPMVDDTVISRLFLPLVNR